MVGSSGFIDSKCRAVQDTSSTNCIVDMLMLTTDSSATSFSEMFAGTSGLGEVVRVVIVVPAHLLQDMRQGPHSLVSLIVRAATLKGNSHVLGCVS